MKIHKVLAAILVSTLFIITSCELDGEENIDWRPGDSLMIMGSSEVEVGTEAEPYYVEGFTIEKNYTWTVNGSAATPARQGEFVYLDFPAAGDYTIMVSSGEYEGILTVSAVE